jgi:ABC-type nitrate/sulfonate/bicarbonate transport system permease component
MAMRAGDLLLKCLGVTAMLLIWEAGGRALGDELFAPPSRVVPELLGMLAAGQVVTTLASSLQQMVLGYALACVIGIPLGTAMGRIRLVDTLLHPWLSILIVTSIASLVPLLIIALGTGFWFRVAVVFLAAVWYVTLTLYQGARGIERRWLDVGRSFGAGTLAMFWKIIVPALLPYVLVALRVGLTHAIRAMVVAEMFILVGFGRLLTDQSYAMSTAPVLALLLMISAIGMAANGLLALLARVAAPWQVSARRDAGGRAEAG